MGESLHEYRQSKIATEMRAIWPKASEADQHFAAIFKKRLPLEGGMRRVMVLGAHDTLIPAVLGGTAFNFVVFALPVEVKYMERQWQYCRLARPRYAGRCLARPMRSPYKAMADFGDYRFQYILVLPGADWNRVRDYCKHYLGPQGVLIVAQNGNEIDAGDLSEMWRTYLKTTEAGYCIETEQEQAEWVVVRYEMDKHERQVS